MLSKAKQYKAIQSKANLSRANTKQSNKTNRNMCQLPPPTRKAKLPPANAEVIKPKTNTTMQSKTMHIKAKQCQPLLLVSRCAEAGPNKLIGSAAKHTTTKALPAQHAGTRATW